jgi:hypothetical protein
LTLNLTVNPKTYATINQTICQGQYYIGRNVSGTYIDTLIGANSKGCDSIRTLNLTVNPKTYGSFSQSICQGQSYAFNGINRTISGAYLDTLVNSKGCDSILTLNLTVNPKTYGSFSQTICQGQSYIFNGINRITSGVYLDTIVNSKGCDSILTLNLTVNSKTTSTVNQTICQGASFFGRTTSGTYIDTLIGANSKGCDSIRTLILTVNPIAFSTINQTICQGDSFLNRTSSGTYVDTLKGASSKGCDSIRTLNLLVNPISYYTFFQTICEGQSFLGRNVTGTFRDTFFGLNSMGCDSIRILKLTVLPRLRNTINYTICQGDSFLGRKNAGIYYDTFINLGSNGCDSIRILNLTVKPITYSLINQGICQSQSFLGRSVTGVYMDTLFGANSNGCDSIRALNLWVYPKTYSVINQAICQGQSFLGKTTTGVYVDTLHGANSNGCDSIRTLNLIVNNPPQINGNITGALMVCQGQNNVLYSVVNVTNTPSSYTWILPNGYSGYSQTSQININYSTIALSGSISVVAQNNCGNSNVVQQNIIVNPKPVKPTITNSSNTLISSSLTGNQWYNQIGPINGANNALYIGSFNNSYYVVVTEQGCSSDPSNVIVLSSSSLSNKNKLNINVYPNPFENEVIVEAGVEGEVQFFVSSVDGKEIYKGAFKDISKIDTRNLISGAYILTLKYNDNIETFKIIRK